MSARSHCRVADQIGSFGAEDSASATQSACGIGEMVSELGWADDCARGFEVGDDEVGQRNVAVSIVTRQRPRERSVTVTQVPYRSWMWEAGASTSTTTRYRAPSSLMLCRTYSLRFGAAGFLGTNGFLAGLGLLMRSSRNVRQSPRSQS